MDYLWNSALMPSEGVYELSKISQHTFMQAIKSKSELISTIGYQQNLDLIAKFTGKTFEINRNMSQLRVGDTAWIMKLNYRPKVKSNKDSQKEENYNYFKLFRRK